MSKNRPRHNPTKKQNNYGSWCDCCEEIDGKLNCSAGAPQHIVETVCKGNRHNCCKVTYRKWAGKSEKQGKPHPESQFTILQEDFS